MNSKKPQMNDQFQFSFLQLWYKESDSIMTFQDGQRTNASLNSPWLRYLITFDPLMTMRQLDWRHHVTAAACDERKWTTTCTWFRKKNVDVSSLQAPCRNWCRASQYSSSSCSCLFQVETDSPMCCAPVEQKDLANPTITSQWYIAGSKGVMKLNIEIIHVTLGSYTNLERP